MSRFPYKVIKWDDKRIGQPLVTVSKPLTAERAYNLASKLNRQKSSAGRLLFHVFDSDKLVNVGVHGSRIMRAGYEVRRLVLCGDRIEFLG